MPALPISSPIAVVGAGTMGSSVAMVAAAAGHTVLLGEVLMLLEKWVGVPPR